jgi:colanic acid biosynthesis protein WcaH
MARIAKNELNIELKYLPKLIGVFEHFYDDSIYENVSTHYVNLAYEYEVEEALDLPTEQHNEYQWFTINELLKSKQVHKYVKDYFRG